MFLKTASARSPCAIARPAVLELFTGAPRWAAESLLASGPGVRSLFGRNSEDALCSTWNTRHALPARHVRRVRPHASRPWRCPNGSLNYFGWRDAKRKGKPLVQPAENRHHQLTRFRGRVCMHNCTPVRKRSHSHTQSPPAEEVYTPGGDPGISEHPVGGEGMQTADLMDGSRDIEKAAPAAGASATIKVELAR